MAIKLSVTDQSPIHDGGRPSRGPHDSLRLAVRTALVPVVYAVCYPAAALALFAGASLYIAFAGAGVRSRA